MLVNCQRTTKFVSNLGACFVRELIEKSEKKVKTVNSIVAGVFVFDIFYISRLFDTISKKMSFGLNLK